MGAASTVKLEVSLKLPDQAAVKAYIAGLSNPNSPDFGRYLTASEFGTKFGPSLSEVAAVRSALEQAGLTPGQTTLNRLTIPVTGTAAAVQRAFATSLMRYRLAGGRLAFRNSSAPSVSAAIAPFVAGVLGLSTIQTEHNMLERPASSPAPSGQTGSAPVHPAAAQPNATGPKACPAAADLGEGSRTATQLASLYGMNQLYGMGDEGAGVKIGILEFEPFTSSDISTYKSCYGVSTSVTETNVDGGVTPGTGQSGEAALDIEDALGLAPASSISVFEGPNSDQGELDVFNAMIDVASPPQVITTSWGSCEQDTEPLLLFDEQTLFEQAATQGQTVFASAGDTGSTDCLEDGIAASARVLNADDPASQPFVVGVGGTSIGATSQSVWNNSDISNGAGGGSVSIAECMPDYQFKPAIPGLVKPSSQTDAADCATKADPKGFMRQVPDVSADADPNTGYVIFFTQGASGSPAGWQIIGGTSAAAPLWAAVAALTDASPFCKDYGSGDAGVRPQGLYAVANADHSSIYASHPEVLSDVKSGNNDYTPSGYKGGLYPATTGYDMASGLGTPLVGGRTSTGAASSFFPGLAAIMCAQYRTKLTSVKVTGISPGRGPLRGRTVTVSGSGFLPIAGADRALVGSTVVAASCSSTTRCTVTIPKHAAGAVNIRINAEDFGYSAVNAHDRFTYTAAPSTRSIAPSHGPARGGTRVTIRGANFIGVTAVHFGTRLGTHVRVVSSTEIIVTAPRGSGTVRVKVTAVGGTSAGAISFRY